MANDLEARPTLGRLTESFDGLPLPWSVCKVVVWSYGKNHLGLVSDRPEALVPMTECVFQRAVEHMNANVQKPLDGIPVPSHLLLLDHRFRDDFIDHRLDKIR